MELSLASEPSDRETEGGDGGDGEREEPLRPAPEWVEHKLLRRFGALPARAVYALAALVFLSFALGWHQSHALYAARDEINRHDFTLLLETPLDWPRILATWPPGVAQGIIYAAMLLNAWSVLRPGTGALARLQNEAAGADGVAMISAADQRDLRWWCILLVLWTCFVCLAELTVHGWLSRVLDSPKEVLGMGLGVPVWVLSLRLAAALAAAKVDAVNRNLKSLDVATCADEEWDAQVRQPAIKLARDILPALSEWGPTIGVVFVGASATILSYVPFVVDHNDHELWTHLLLVGWLPLFVAFSAAGVTSRCNALLEKLNELRCLGVSPSPSAAHQKQL